MPQTIDQHTTRVQQFCSDLQALEPNQVIRKHITTGSPVFLTEDLYFKLRSLIADQFDVHPSEVVLVGSCRMGFSILQRKRYREAKPDSDLDVAIVSAERFDRYWDAVFGYAASNMAWRESKEYSKFVGMLFEGWIDPRGLPTVARFKQAASWSRFFDTLMQSREFGRRRISARLYRTWSRLEAYQEIAVRQCIVHLGGPHA